MWIGWLELDLLLGDVHSLKEKRSVVRPIVAELRRRFSVSAAENRGLGPQPPTRPGRRGGGGGGPPPRGSLCPPPAVVCTAATTSDGAYKWRLRRAGVGGATPGASRRALIRNAVCPRIRCCGRTARPTTSQPRCRVSHARGSVQHCCS